MDHFSSGNAAAEVEHSKRRLKHLTGIDRLATGSSVGSVLFGKMIPTAAIPNRSAESFRIYSASNAARNFEIGPTHVSP